MVKSKLRGLERKIDMTIQKVKGGILILSDRTHDPDVRVENNKEADLQDLDRLIRAYPDESLDILMTCRNIGGARGILNKCRRRMRKKIKNNEIGIVHHIEGEEMLDG